MTSALPLHPSSSAFSFNPSFLSSSYPPQPSSTASYAGLSPGFSFHPNSNPFFAASPPSSSAFVGGGWDPHPLSTSSSPPFATSTLNSLQLGNGNEYLYTNNDAQSMSDTQSLSDGEGGGGGAASPEQQGGGGGARTSSSTTNVVVVEPQAQAPQKKPAANKRKKSPTKKKVSASGSDDEEDEGDHEGGGGGKRRGSGGGGSELGSGDGEGRGTTLAEVLAEQGLTQEIYNGLPSAKKRQLRNKVSARAFRARRKDYIETLEGELAQKDGKVEAQRAEIARLKNENQLLRTRLRHSNNDH